LDKTNKLNSIEVFLKVAKLESFSEAAKQLSLSKAMVSKHVTNLENSLGVRLLNRTTRQLGLTEAGIAYRVRIREIMNDMTETELAITQLSTEPQGTLRIMAPTSFGSFHLTRAIADYRKIYTKVGIEAVLTEREPDIIEDGLDMVIKVGVLEDSSLVARKIADARMSICASESYLEEYGVPLTPEDLFEHNCLIYSGRQPMGEWRFTVDAKIKKIRVKGDVRSNVGDALRIAAIQGCGLVQLPRYMTGLDLKSGRLKAVLEDYAPPARPIHAIYPHRQHLSAKVRTFVEFLYQCYQPEPYWESWMKND
jgi:DNA-binding transcriptional LysR family regulator